MYTSEKIQQIAKGFIIGAERCMEMKPRQKKSWGQTFSLDSCEETPWFGS